MSTYFVNASFTTEFNEKVEYTYFTTNYEAAERQAAHYKIQFKDEKNFSCTIFHT